MTAYIIRRLLLIVPTLFGILLLNFLIVQAAPGGPVEQTIAHLTGLETGAGNRMGGNADSVAPGQSGQAVSRIRNCPQVQRQGTIFSPLIVVLLYQ